MDELLKKVSARRAQVEAYIRKIEPRNRRLINLAIICGIAGTAFAGVPAVGGSSAIESLKAATQPNLPIWQILCIGAALCTMIATIATSLRSNHETGGKLARAQACCARLEMLELLMISEKIELKEAIEKYGDFSADVSFLT